MKPFCFLVPITFYKMEHLEERIRAIIVDEDDFDDDYGDDDADDYDDDGYDNDVDDDDDLYIIGAVCHEK